MKYTKSELEALEKKELLELHTKFGKTPPHANTPKTTLIANILTAQATYVPTDEDIEVMTKKKLDESLTRVAEMEAKYAKMINDLEISKGLQPTDEQLHRYSKEEAEYESIQLKLRERKKLTPSQRAREVTKELTALVRVRVTEIRPRQEAKDIDNHMLIVSWGNSVVSGNTKVPFNTPWHIPVGCYRNLLNATVRESIQPAKGSTKAMFSKPTKRFDVTVLEPLTDDELKTIKERQLLMRTSGVSVV